MKRTDAINELISFLKNKNISCEINENDNKVSYCYSTEKYFGAITILFTKEETLFKQDYVIGSFLISSIKSIDNNDVWVCSDDLVFDDLLCAIEDIKRVSEELEDEELKDLNIFLQNKNVKNSEQNSNISDEVIF